MVFVIMAPNTEINTTKVVSWSRDACNCYENFGSAGDSGRNLLKFYLAGVY